MEWMVESTHSIWNILGSVKTSAFLPNFIPLESTGFLQELGGHCKDLDYWTNDSSFISIPCNNEGGPHIHINPWIGGQPNLTDHTVEDWITMREEEEEESEEEAAGA